MSGGLFDELRGGTSVLRTLYPASLSAFQWHQLSHILSSFLKNACFVSFRREIWLMIKLPMEVGNAGMASFLRSCFSHLVKPLKGDHLSRAIG